MRPAVRPMALGVALALLWACDDYHDNHCTAAIGSGHLVTESRPVQDFTAVALSDAGHLIIEQTGVESLQITAEDNVLPFVRSDVRNGRLVLGLEPGASVTLTREILFRLTVRDLSEIEASGASRVEARRVDTGELTTRISGASAFSATGFAERQQLDLSGASSCDTSDLQSHVLTANLSGASYGLVRASDSLVVNASGASVLEYLGDPALVANASGGSVVRRVGP